MIHLEDNQQIDKYSVIYFIIESGFCSSYRVMGAGGKSFFMKLFDLSAMPAGLVTANEPNEIRVCKTLDHASIITYVDSGWITLEGRDFAFLVTDFIVGELLSDAMEFSGLMTVSDKLTIVSSVAKALEYMASRKVRRADRPGGCCAAFERDGGLQGRAADVCRVCEGDCVAERLRAA